MLLLDPGSVKRIRPEAVGASSALKCIKYQKRQARKTSCTASQHQQPVGFKHCPCNGGQSRCQRQRLGTAGQ